MEYSEEQIEQLNNSFDDIYETFKKKFFKIPEIFFNEKRADEFFKHGFFRRFQMLFHCIERVFEIYPPDRKIVLEDSERLDIEVYIQTFIINLYGAIDNLAWIINEEYNLNLSLLNITIFNKSIQSCFSKEFTDYINNDNVGGFKNWYDKHCKVFRHAVGHRIPLYVPPYGVSNIDKYNEIAKQRINAILNRDFDKVNELNIEEKTLEHILPLYVHSFAENSPYVIIHSQLIADFRTLIELYDNFLKDCYRGNYD